MRSQGGWLPGNEDMARAFSEKGRAPPPHFNVYRAPGLAARPAPHGRVRRPKWEPAEMGGAMNEHAVVIAGGGPTGLMLAAELALARIDVAVVERRASQAVAGVRALGLHSRTIEVLDQRGVADRFL